MRRLFTQRNYYYRKFIFYSFLTGDAFFIQVLAPTVHSFLFVCLYIRWVGHYTHSMMRYLLYIHKLNLATAFLLALATALDCKNNFCTKKAATNVVAKYKPKYSGPLSTLPHKAVAMTFL